MNTKMKKVRKNYRKKKESKFERKNEDTSK